MRKKVIGISVGLIFVAGVLYLVFFSYEKGEQLYGFPIPKSAEVTNQWSGFAEYDWAPASEEDGLPFYYKWQIEWNGWKEVSREGSLTTYEKDNHQINVISQTDYLSVFKEN